MYSDNQVQVLNAIADDYAGQLLASIKQVLNEPRYRNTGRGVGSVQVDVVKGDSSKSPALVVKLEDYVLLLDKSKMEWTRLPNIRNLVEWARSKQSDEKQAQKLAWAKAWDLRRNDNWKPKKWRKRALGTVLASMNDRMLKDFEQAIERDFQQVIDENLKG